MPTAQDVLSETLERLSKNWMVINSLRVVVNMGLPHAENALGIKFAAMLKEVATDPKTTESFIKLETAYGGDKEKAKEVARDSMTNFAVTNARTAIDAASLVFAHSIVDDCAWSCCKVCSLAMPEDWKSEIGAKKVEFAALGRSTDKIREELIEAKLNQIEKESLLVKVDLLFRLCRPPKDFSPFNNYAFDRDRLERIDEDRRQIIHKNGLGTPLPNIEEDLKFLGSTGSYFVYLVAGRYTGRFS